MKTKTTMMMMMNKKIFFAVFFAFALTLSASSQASELTDAANNDWLELVRKYSSEDKIIKIKTDDIDSKWNRLIKNSSENKSENEEDDFLSEWQQIFNDEVLTDLIKSAFKSNRDLISSRAKVLEARAALGIVRTDFGVKPDFNAGYTNGRNSDFEDDEEKSYNKYSVGFDASWEIDFWGRKKHEFEAAKANLESENAEHENAKLSLASEVAMNYFNLRVLQKRLEIAENNLASQNELLEILKSQLKSGLADETSLKQLQSETEMNRAKIPEIKKSLNQTMNAIAILTGAIPKSIDGKLSQNSKEKIFPDIEISKFIGIPAETLKQRPDIRAAERKFAAQIQKRKAAEKSIYPVIQLTGAIGFESSSTGNLFSSGSYTYSIGPALKWPIFNMKEIRKNIQVQSAIEEQLLAEFEDVILKAVGEVHDALDANVQEISRNEFLKKALENANENFEIAKNKYSNGLINFADVLKVQQEVFSIKDEFVSSEGQKFINLIALLKSLGGEKRVGSRK